MEEGKVFAYGSPSLGIEYSSEYRLGFFHCINWVFYIPLEASSFLSWRNRALAIWRIFTVGKDQRFGYCSPENYNAEVLLETNYYLGNQLHIHDLEVIILYPSQIHYATIFHR